MPVYDADNADIGAVNEVILDASGEIEALVIDVGGFLGMGRHTVAVAFESVEMAQDSGATILQVSFSEDQLRSQPVYEPEVYRQGGENAVLR